MFPDPNPFNAPGQQPSGTNEQPVVPQQQGPDPNIQPSFPPYPSIPDNTPVDPRLPGFIINLPPSAMPYQVVRPWHMAFEVWAYEDGLNGGYVSHFNLQVPEGPMLHVYYNAFGQLEVVGIGQRPTGY